MDTHINLANQRVPFVNSPFYNTLRSQTNNKELLKYSDELNENGYTVIDLNLSEELIQKVNFDIDQALSKDNIKLNSKAYHYNDSPRIVEAWKFSDSIKQIANNAKLNKILNFCYQSEPIPFSTINFIKGTEQPLHSDEFHFGTIPHGYLTGCWIALEDIHQDSGPLAIAEKSHKLPLFSFEMVGLKIPKSESEFKQNYTIYESWVKEIIKAQNLKIKEIPIKKGQCIIWLSNTLHGAFAIKNNQLSRKSLVVHYHYEKCEKIFYPSYSNLENGKHILRSLQSINSK